MLWSYSIQTYLVSRNVYPDGGSYADQLKASLSAQQAFARNELTLQLTTLIDDLCAASEGTDLVRTSLRTFKNHNVWPLDHRRMSISVVLNALDCIDMGVMVNHYCKQRVSTTEAQAVRDIEVAAKEATIAANQNHLAAKQRRDFARSIGEDWGEGGGGWGDVDPGSTQLTPQPRPKLLIPFSRVPSRGDMELLIAKVKERCVGVCLDCISGVSAKCRYKHPDPWEGWEVPCTCGSSASSCLAGWGGCVRDASTQKPPDWELIW